jgi:hypothetical protein
MATLQQSQSGRALDRLCFIYYFIFIFASIHKLQTLLSYALLFWHQSLSLSVLSSASLPLTIPLYLSYWLSVHSLIGGCDLDGQKMVALCEGLQICPALEELSVGE